jgi:hypothetical protein
MGTLQVGGTTLATKNVSTGKVDLSANYRPPAGGVIEQFCSPCDGSSITVQSGTYTVQNVTAVQEATTSFVTLSGSEITYTPPAGTQTVIYEFQFYSAYTDAGRLGSFRLSIGGSEVTKARHAHSSQSSTFTEQLPRFMWPFHIGGSADASSGRQATWTTGKVIKLELREYNSSLEFKVHETEHWDGTGDNQTVTPVISITALG